VTEATGPNDEFFGDERTQAIISRSASEIATVAQQFGQADDITVVKVRHTPCVSLA
jgi:serine phosphatase RsbU (regulator of sigma subunit)